VNFASKGIEESSLSNYAPDWKHWSEFHHDIGSNDLYLESILGDDVNRAYVWTLFMTYLYSKGRRAEQIMGILSSVRYLLLTRFSSISFLNNEIVVNSRKACRRSPEEQREYIEACRLREKLPLNIEMILDMRRHLWETTDWNFDGIMSRCVWVASALSFDRGTRSSNVTLPDGTHALDHNLRCRQVIFIFKVGSTITRVEAGPRMNDAERSDNSLIINVNITIITSKSSGSCRSNKVAEIVLTRDHSTAVSQLIDDLADFSRHSGSQGDQPFFSFYRTSPVTDKRLHKVLTRKDLVTEVQNCAERFNLPRAKFATKSFRKGNATQSGLSNIPKEERNRIGGWAPRSRVPDQHYDSSAQYRGALDLAEVPGSTVLTTEQLRARASHTTR
jgi:hypothetical protein